MNRIYYSMFYAALALLAARNLSGSKHSGVIALVHREFVRTGELPPELARNLDRAFDLRLMGDYREFVELNQADLERLLVGAEQFIDAAKVLLGNQIS